MYIFGVSWFDHFIKRFTCYLPFWVVFVGTIGLFSFYGDLIVIMKFIKCMMNRR